MTTTAIPSARARRRNPFWQLTRTEAVLFARSPGAVIWAALVPLLAVVVLGLVPVTRHPSAAYGGHSPLEIWLPIIMMYVLVMSAVNLLPAVLAGYRDRGILRRLSTTPVPPSRLLGAQALIFLGVGVVLDVVLLVVGTAFGVPAPGLWAGFVLALLLVAGATLGLGMLLTALARTERAANALGLVTFFPLMFFAGLWLPRQNMSPLLRTLSDYSPLGAGVRAVQDSIDGHWPAAGAVLVLVAWAVVCGAAATRLFRWE